MNGMSTHDTTPAPAPRSRRGEGTYDERRIALAESALKTLGELGYARTSLRDIAANSEFTHGVVHYYFRNKTELIIFCVRHYKSTCVKRYDGVVESASTPEALVAGFARKLIETLVEESSMHRLWYDLRSQGMFHDELVADIQAIDLTLQDMIWRIVTRYSQLAGCAPVGAASVIYPMLDGVFERALRDHLSGDEGAPTRLSDQVHGLMPLLLSPSGA